MIPDSFKQDLLNRVDIVDLVERHVRLKKAGANFVACCPFHNEKSPSFTVSPSKQFYHCFGCGAHGNAISFVMEYQGLGYVEAVKELADSAGMKLPEFERWGGASKAESEGTDLYAVMKQAEQYYREQLKNAPAAIAYLKGRGLTGTVAARFAIGYAPDGWQNLQAVFPDYAARALKDCGLVIDGEGGRRYDRFRDRIMFPILNQRGSVIGFGGRVLGEGEPKYLNSPETPLFEKGRELYGLSQARTAVREAGRVVVVEGYMDVVALAQHGIEYAVATLGTATSPTHVQKLFRQTDEIVFCFDGDAAGRRAAWHALEVSLPVLADQKAVKFLFLPAEDDPDSYVRAHGRQAFERLLAEARPLSEFFLAELRSRVDMATLEGCSRLIHEAKPLLKRIAAPALQLQLLKQVAQASGVTQEEAGRLTEIRGAAPGRPVRSAPPKGPDRAMLNRKLDRELLACLLAHPPLVREVPAEVVDVSHAEGRALEALIALDGIEALTHAVILELLRESEHASLLNRIRSEFLHKDMDTEVARAEFDAVIEAIRRRNPNPRIKELGEKAAREGLTGQERDEFGRLIAEDAALKQRRMPPSTVL
ncbi:MAG: DNA primase [Betaproteobacteria bacterium RBG_16_64_18]|nr:MAG: DNA primase [Betaproteobacteria bacterium RBG_16_64_18]